MVLAAPAFLAARAGRRILAYLGRAVGLARDLVTSGKVLSTLRRWVGAQHRTPAAGLAQLQAVAQRAGVAL